MATRRRRCKKGSLKRKVKTRAGGTRRCRKTRRRSKRSKSRRKYKMLTVRENTDGGASKAKLMKAAENPSTENLKALKVGQLNILCKMFNLEGCTTRNKSKKISFMRTKLKALAGGKSGGPPGMIMPPPSKSLAAVVGPPSLKLNAVLKTGSIPTKDQLQELTVGELDLFCRKKGIPECSSRTKLKKINHILRKLTPPSIKGLAGPIGLAPPPTNLDKATILSLSTSGLKKLCRAIPALAPCTTIRGKAASKKQLLDKVLVHYNHYVIGNASVMSASMGKLKRLCTRFGIQKCYVKTATLENLRLQVAAHPAVGGIGT